MTRKEQAYVKRLKKRIDDLLSGYQIIKTWLSYPDDATTRCYHIGKLATQKILDEKAAKEKEKGGAA